MPAHAARSFVAMAIARAMGTTEPPSEGTTETVSAAAASAASTYPETASRACAKVSLSPHCVAAFTSVRAASERAAVVAAASRAAAPSHARNVSSALRSSSLWEATSLDHLSREIKCEPGLRRCVLSTQWCSRTSSKLPRRLDFTGGASAARERTNARIVCGIGDLCGCVDYPLCNGRHAPEFCTLAKNKECACKRR